MDVQVRVAVAEAGADAERLDTVTRYLREELVQLDVEAVTPAPGTAAPDGTRGLDAIALGGLLVSIGNSQALRSVVTTVRGWLRRGEEPGRTVRLEIDGDVLELSNATRSDQEHLVELFLTRHAAPPGVPSP
ncbi:hypothetical protein [Cellulomonas biazotea]|uniref:Uncharacterized protein n=1 Tax=Cellulomonas biazotea TaxID=1709 RepID=A0A402DRI2_9CELL|nr:hypothetical protein [Cellulomonas biazotea]GCE76705.1 hypothetical protein CBZ_17610 [Cellulomonas biazotea]